LTFLGAIVLTKPVIATITVAIPPINKELKMAAARIISVGLFPSRIQAEGFSMAGEFEGINCEVWVEVDATMCKLLLEPLSKPPNSNCRDVACNVSTYSLSLIGKGLGVRFEKTLYTASVVK
jgi:hypothetical protein